MIVGKSRKTCEAQVRDVTPEPRKTKTAHQNSASIHHQSPGIRASSWPVLVRRTISTARHREARSYDRKRTRVFPDASNGRRSVLTRLPWCANPLVAGHHAHVERRGADLWGDLRGGRDTEDGGAPRSRVSARDAREVRFLGTVGPENPLRCSVAKSTARGVSLPVRFVP